MRTEELFPILDRAYEITTTTDVSMVPFIRGTPGGGKTQKITQWTEARGLKLATLYLPSASPTDIVCYMPDSKTSMLRAFFNERLPHDKDWRGVLFFDEITKGHPEVVKTAIKLINERKLDGYTCPPGLMFVCAGNTLESRSGDLRLPAAFSNRLEHYEFTVDAEEVAEYFAEKGYPPEVSAYLLGAPDSVERFKPEDQTWPNPRTWERVAVKMMYADKHHRSLSVRDMAADIGEAEAKAFHGALENMKTLPPLSDIISKPKTTRVPEKMSDQFAVLAMAAYRADKDTFGAIAQYIQRMALNRHILFLRLVRRRHDKSFLQVKEYVEWIVKPEITQALTGQLK